VRYMEERPPSSPPKARDEKNIGLSALRPEGTTARKEEPRLTVPPRLLKAGEGTMTREEYLAWRDAS
jgi:hypothetical protein